MSQLLSLSHFKVENSFAQSLQSLCTIFTNSLHNLYGKTDLLQSSVSGVFTFLRKSTKLWISFDLVSFANIPKMKIGRKCCFDFFSFAEFLVCQSASSLQVFVTRSQNSWRSRSFRGKKTKKAGHPSATLIDQSPQRPFFSFFSTSFQ